jgi:predicted RNase H-like nuclease
MSEIMGVDGSRNGWFAVARDSATGVLRWQRFASADEIVTTAPAVVAIDIPIGLPPAGARACDVAARRLLGRPRASSVFPAPPRAVLDARGYDEACAMRDGIEGKRLSRQAWGIVAKIREVDRLLQRQPAQRHVFHEAHPEVSLHHLAGRAMAHSKKHLAGIGDRADLLASVFGDPVAGALADRRRFGAAADDVLDAFAVLWTAIRFAAGQHTVLGDGARDEAGLRMEIIA